MIRRMASEAHQPELVRGFVRSSELIADLSWDTREPSENHVKQLVRRVRRALIKSEIGDLIESRHRFGNRYLGHTYEGRITVDIEARIHEPAH